MIITPYTALKSVFNGADEAKIEKTELKRKRRRQ
jgi:hypothetical protein